MNNDFFTFENFVSTFLNQDIVKISKHNILEEFVGDSIEDPIEATINEEVIEDDDLIIKEDVAYEVEEVLEEITIEESKYDTHYKLYKDKSEDFVCDISIEGADPNETEARIVIESKDWSLMFRGTLIDGKCIVPIKKLNILQEGQVGNIRLEVIAEGNLFIPWEDKFKVKLSKKVTVKVNEQKEDRRKNGVSVKVKR